MQNPRDASRLFVQPVLIVLTATSLALTAYVVWLSLRDVSLLRAGQDRFVGLANYARFLEDGRALAALWRTVLFTTLATGIEVTLGVAVVLFLDRHFRLKRLVRTLLLVPIIMTPVVVGTIPGLPACLVALDRAGSMTAVVSGGRSVVELRGSVADRSARFRSSMLRIAQPQPHPTSFCQKKLRLNRGLRVALSAQVHQRLGLCRRQARSPHAVLATSRHVCRVVGVVQASRISKPIGSEC